MWSNLVDLFSILSFRQRASWFALQFFSFGSACLQILSIASIAPFVSLLSKPDILTNNATIRIMYSFTGSADYKDFLFTLGLCVMLLVVISNSFTCLTFWLQAKFSMQLGNEFQNKLYSKYLYNEYSFFLEGSSSKLIASITHEIPRVIYMVIQPLFALFSQLMIALLIVVGLLIYDPILSAFAIITIIVVYYLIYITLRSKTIEAGRIISEMDTVKLQLLNSSIHGITEVKLIGTEPWFIKELDRTTAKGLSADTFIELSGELPRLIVEAAVFVAILVLGISLINNEQDNSAVLTTLSLYALAGYKILPACQTIYKSMTSIRGNCDLIGNVKSNLESVIVDEKIQNDKRMQSSQIDGNKQIEIKLADVSYSYPKNNTIILKNINLKLARSGVVAFVGKSGSGKTTLANILAGLLSPDDGALTVNGTSITALNRKLWRKSIGYVSQSIFIFDDTVLNNICFGFEEQDIDLDKAIDAAKKANLHDFISKQSKGYNFRVGENGSQLSGGQKQRLGIARALYREPRLLILDEATSALDNKTEQAVMEEVYKLSNHMIVVVITHRISAIKRSDVINVMNDGKVVASGTYKELSEYSEIFATLDEG